LVDANRRLESAEQQVLGGGEGGADRVVGQGGKRVLAQCVGTGRGGKQSGRGAAQLGGNLLGEDDAQAETDGGGDGKLTATQQARAFGHGAHEDGLDVDAEQGGRGGGTGERGRVHGK